MALDEGGEKDGKGDAALEEGMAATDGGVATLEADF